jgi:hypothetical protein
MDLAPGVRTSVLRLIVVAAVVTSCNSSSVAPSQASATRRAPIDGRVLFIGNSLTEANGLPEVVETLSRQGGGTPISATSVVFGGFSLEDHWNEGTARRRIAEGGWSIVVLQQGPSSLPESQASLREWTARFDAVIRATGARTALYMVWPESNRREAFDAVSRSYARAAEDVGGMLFPVGEAWRRAWSRDAEMPLYGPDGFHPTPTATYLAALVMYQQINDRSPVGLPPGTQMAADRALLLQEAAQEANAQFGRRSQAVVKCGTACELTENLPLLSEERRNRAAFRLTPVLPARLGSVPSQPGAFATGF